MCKSITNRAWAAAFWIGLFGGGYLTCVALNNWIMDLLGIIGK